MRILRDIWSQGRLLSTGIWTLKGVESLFAVLPSLVLAWLVGAFEAGGDAMSQTVFAAFIYSAVWAASRMISPGLTQLYGRVEQRLQTRFIVDAIQRQESASPLDRAAIGDAELSFAIDSGAEGIRNSTWAVVSSIVPAVLNAVVGLVMFMTLYGYAPAAVFVVAVCVLIFGSRPIIRRHQARQHSSMEEAMSSFGVLQNTLEFWRESRILGVGDYLRERYRADRRKFEQRAHASYMTTGLLQIFQISVIAAGIFGMVYAYAIQHVGVLKAADIVAIIGISVATLVPLQSLGFGVSSLSSGVAQIRQSESVLKQAGSDGYLPATISSVFSAEPAILSVQNFHCESFGGGHALRVTSFKAPIGQITWVLGPSGSGKTVFLDGLAGLAPVRNGTIEWSGRSRCKASVGYLRQSAPVLAADLMENVELGRDRGNAALESLKNLELLAACDTKSTAHQIFPRGDGSRLSGGQERRMLLARVLLNDPDILICDEPTTCLDRESRAIVWQLLEQESQKRIVIVSTHDPEAPMRESDSSLDIVGCAVPHTEVAVQ
ncbi:MULTISPECIES: ATP-binding cassette domain-containing protein [Arthrobacter]|uniref:ATP-binding cassette domain-containing protein n=1 Tax=Arthrobacter TaxID=1663 RepID=UPI00138E4E85|nr:MULTISPECIES: ABC transporter ATP-binding protein [Arthrobacter]